MFKKKKKNKSPTVNEITQRLRGFLLDSQVDHPHELAVLLGTTPLSDELQEKEEQESDVRVERIAYLTPLLYAYSHTMAEGAIEYQRKNEEIAKAIPDEIWMQSRRMMEHVALSAMMGSISQLVDMGLLNTRKAKR